MFKWEKLANVESSVSLSPIEIKKFNYEKFICLTNSN